MAGDGVAEAVDWRQVSDLLADEVESLGKRLASSPGLTEADDERLARAAVALRQYRAARVDDDLT